jgi:hypothetical protein
MDMEALRIQARKHALAMAKTFGWPLAGVEYQDEFESKLESLIKNELNEEKGNGGETRGS